jgi:hypothetical protein
MTKELPSREYVASLLAYDAETGEFRWLKSRQGIRAGKAVGSIQTFGYRQITIDRRQYLAHRIAWLLTYGKWPDGVIDHINGDGDDNRISNLRACTQSENLQNTKIGIRNTTGIKGVSWDKSKKAWRAAVMIKGRSVWAGYHQSIDDATRAVMELRERLHGEFANHGGIKLDAIAVDIQ